MAQPDSGRSNAVAGIVLAAGSSSRFGEPKQLLKYAGRTLVEHAVGAASRAELSPLAVVASEDLRDRVAYTLRQVTPPPTVIVNPRAEHGIGTSLRAGASAVPDDIGAVVVLVADQPLVTPDLILRVIAAWRDGRGSIVRPVFGSSQGHPVLFDGVFLPELRRLSPAQAGRSVVAAHPGELHVIEVEDPDLLFDVDTPDDYMRLLRLAWRGERDEAG